MKKTFTLWFVCTVAVSLVFSGCSSSSGDGAGPAAAPDNTPAAETAAPDAGPVELSIFAPPKPGIDLVDNRFTELVEEKFNIKINWEISPQQGQRQKKKLMFASGDYTDVFFHAGQAEEGLTRQEQQQLGKEGILVPLNDLIEKYAPNIKQAMEDIPYLRKGITAPDGNIYALTGVNECFHCYYSQKMWINTKWLQNLGLTMPTTTEQFYEVLKAFKEKDANGNGDPNDEIPLTGATNGWRNNVDGFIMNAFIYNNSEDYMVVNDGKVGLAPSRPEWAEGLKYLHRLFAEGLIDPAAYTQNDEALGQLGRVKGEYSILGAVPAGWHGGFLDYSGDPRAREYDTVPPLIGPAGVQTTAYYGGVGDGDFAITNKASEEQRIKAIQLVDYMFTEEGTVLAEFGPLGEGMLSPADPGALGLDGKPAKYKTTLDASGNAIAGDALNHLIWDIVGPRYLPTAFRMSWTAAQDPYSPEGLELRLYQETKNKYEGKEPKEVFLPSYFINPDDQNEYSQLKTQINKYIKESIVQFITGNKKVDTDWDAYIEGLKEIGMDRYLEIQQAAYDAAK